MNSINYKFIEDYIRLLLPDREGILKELEKEAAKKNIPIIEPEVARLLEILLYIKQPYKVLEIGTAIGYSTIVLAKALKNGEITTIEKDEEFAEEAEKNFKKADVSNVHLIRGDALKVLPHISESFDFIFIDAAKGKYTRFLPYCMKLLKDNAILVADNVLFRGMVASDRLIKRRKITIVKRLRKFLKAICSNTDLETVVIPIGDGVSISIKRGENA